MDNLEQKDIDDISPTDEDILEKAEDLQASATIKTAILSGVVLGLQICFVILFAVITMVSSDSGSSTSAAPLPSGPTEPMIFELRLPAVADTYISQAEPSINYGDETTLVIARENESAANVLIAFTLPDLSNHTIKSVDLLITPESAWDTNAPDLKIMICKGAWNEQAVNWNQRPDGGALLGFLPKGQGFDGQTLCIPLDRHAFSRNRIDSIWLGTSVQSATHRFASREAGEKGPVLIIKAEGIAPPPEVNTGTPAGSEKGSGNPPPNGGAGANTAKNSPDPEDKQHNRGQWEKVLFEDFEQPDVQGYSEGTLPDNGNWVGSAVGYGCIKKGIVDKQSGDFSAPDPNHQAFALRYKNTGIASARGVIGSLQIGVTYRVSIEAVRDDGKKADTAATDYWAELVAFAPGDDYSKMNNSGSGTILATFKGSASDNGKFSTVHFVFTPDPVEHASLIGKDVSLRFRKKGNTAIIDNILVEVCHP